jgi:hypothetical protein
MAFSYTKGKDGVLGDLVCKIITYTNTLGSTGGHIPNTGTGLRWIYFAKPTTEVTEGDTSPLIKKNKASNGTTLQAGGILLTTVADEDGTILILGK